MVAGALHRGVHRRVQRVAIGDHGREAATPADRGRLTVLSALDDPTEAEITEIVAILERSGAREFTRSEAQRWRDECFTELDGLEAVDPAARDQLRGIINGVISA